MIFRFLCIKKIDKTIILILSCVISYVLLSVTSIFYKTNSTLLYSGIVVIESIILSIIISKIFSWKLFKKFMVKSFHKTPNDEIWKDIFDFDVGSNIKVYFKNQNYYAIGHYKLHEENGEKSWFAISAYGRYNVTTDEPIGNTHHDNTNIIMTFRLDDVEHIEVY